MLIKNPCDDIVEWRGKVVLTRQNAKTGEIIEQRAVKNSVTNLANQQICKILAATANNPYTDGITSADYIELGQGSGTPSVVDTDLFKPVVATLKQCSYVQAYLGTYLQFSATWLSNDPYVPGHTWTEAGLFDFPGNLWAHVMLGNFSINSGEVATIQWQILFAGG